MDPFDTCGGALCSRTSLNHDRETTRMNADGFSPEFLDRQRKERERREAAALLCSVTSVGGSKLLLREEVYQIVGCAFEVLKGLGHGFHEKPYENALAVEFNLRGIPFMHQPRFPVIYKGVNIGEYVPDLIVFGAVVVEMKVIDTVTDHERGQMLNYLRITEHKVGVILNFKHARLEWERIVLERAR
jgi:GxxExxY protein